MIENVWRGFASDNYAGIHPDILAAIGQPFEHAAPALARASGWALLSIVLAGTHWKAYVSGRQAVQAKYEAAAAQQEKAYRAKEQALVAAKQEVEVRYAQLKKRNAADAAGSRGELERLRDSLAQREAPADAPAVPRANGGSGLERELLLEGAAALAELAAEADRLEAMVVGLQGYVRNVCLK